jgi:hypothetical protein
MSLIAIVVLGIVLGFGWRLLRLAFRLALLLVLIAAIANYGSHLSQHDHPAPPAVQHRHSAHPAGYRTLSPRAAAASR